jgi:hypothetical protein
LSDKVGIVQNVRCCQSSLVPAVYAVIAKNAFSANNRKSMSLEDAKVRSEIFHNYAAPIATIMGSIIVAALAVDGAKQIATTVIEARGAGSIATATAALGTATGAANARGEGATAVSVPAEGAGSGAANATGQGSEADAGQPSK